MSNKLKVILIFAIVILVSFIPEAFPDFFGDWKCQGGSYVMKDGHYHSVGCLYGGNYQHNPTTHWGFRHWMWALCGVVLSIWNIIEMLDKEYK
jgi:hypothetical protein